ncbi:MAG: hypothetical protein JJU00_18500 [Opitutales bacterium]|nr:hypothetical protein [Opitutales bacterium]
MKHLRSLLISGAALAAVAAAQARTVDLFLDLDDTGRPVASISADDPRLDERSAVLQPELAREGWHWGEFTDTFDAYIPDEDMGKDLEPVDGARVFLEADPRSPVLTRVGSGDRVEVLDSGPMWSARIIDKTIPVYYKRPARGPSPAAERRAEAPAPRRAEPATPAAVDREPEQIRLIDRADRSGEARRDPPPAPRRTTEAEAPRRAEGTRSDLPAEGIAKSFEGTFRQARRSVFRANPAPYELIDARGRRVAWVDISGAIIPRGLASLLDQNVVIHGTWEQASPRPEVLVRAKNIRPR